MLGNRRELRAVTGKHFLPAPVLGGRGGPGGPWESRGAGGCAPGA